MPRSSDGLMISRTSWLRLASKRSSSASEVIPELCEANCRSSRIVSPIGVPPGSRVIRYGTPERSSRAANLCTCVDFPLPSDPSNVMNGSRGMTSIVKQASAIVEYAAWHSYPDWWGRGRLACSRLVQQAGCPPAPQAWKPVLRYPDEKFLARETGTILVFVVGLCRGRPNQLDWRTQVLCPQQSS